MPDKRKVGNPLALAVLSYLTARAGRGAGARVPELRGGPVDEAAGQGVPGLFLVEEDYRVAMLDAEVAFVERFIDRITAPDDGWGALWAQFHGEPWHTGNSQPGSSD